MSKDQRGEAAIVGFSVMVILTTLLSVAGPFDGRDFVDKIYGGMTLNDGGGHGLGLTGFHGIFDKVYMDSGK